MLKTKETLREKSKVELFNKLYNTKLDCYNFDGSYNGITLAEHLKGMDLKTLLQDKPTVYTIVRRVSPNGMNRDMSFFCIDKESNELINITYLVSLIVDEREPKQNKYYEHIIRVSGTGMNMVFHMVYTLGNIMFRDIERDIDESGNLFNYKSI